MTKTRWIIFAIIVVAILGGLIFLNRSNNPEFEGDAAKVITQGPIEDRVYGSKDEKVVLIEYGDFECPACGSIFPTVKKLKDTYKDELTFVFRNFPLTSSHPNAYAAAAAAEAAGQQGKFYQMHDLLYENQAAWNSRTIGAGKAGPIFDSFAEKLGLNMNTFKQDMQSKQVSTKISRDRQTAGDFNVSATPTFILNGKKVEKPNENLEREVKDALKKAGYKLE